MLHECAGGIADSPATSRGHGFVRMRQLERVNPASHRLEIQQWPLQGNPAGGKGAAFVRQSC